MKYVIMASPSWQLGPWKEPKHLAVIGGEVLIERTIRLLKENGVDDIVITTNDSIFERCSVPIIKFDSRGHWLNGFYKFDEPVCYIFGDVYFSPEAIKTIVETPTEFVEFFASAPPFSTDYPKQWAEPFAFKVVNYIGFQNAIAITKRLDAEGRFKRRAVSWELWQVIKGTELNNIDYTNYVAINDYTCDIDYPEDIAVMEKHLREVEDGTKLHYMIHACPQRLWYVENYLVPSLEEQGCKGVEVVVDTQSKGSMSAYMNSFMSLPNDNTGTWHLQDDIIICKDFGERTRQHNRGVVCGFGSDKYDGNRPAGLVDVTNKWFSFPCIRIPNRIARSCASWVTTYIIGNRVYDKFWCDGKNEDWAFWMYLKDYHKNIKILNLAPNLVDHIDWLIGGSASAKHREVPCRSKCWQDEDLVQKLKEDLEHASS